MKQSLHSFLGVSWTGAPFTILPAAFSGRRLFHVPTPQCDVLFTHYPHHAPQKINKDQCILQALQASTFVPRLYDVKTVPGEGTLMMSDYIEGHTISFAEGKQHAVAILDLFKSLHAYPCKGGHHAYDIFSQIMDFQKPVAALLKDWSHDVAVIYAILASVTSAHRASTWVHHDVHIGNIILSPASQIYFIDWEYAGLGDPFADLAIASINLAFSTDEALAFFARYQERPVSHRDAAQFLLLRMCALYRVGLYYLSLKDNNAACALLACSDIPSFDELASTIATNPEGLGPDGIDHLIKAAIGVFRREQLAIETLLKDC